MAVTLKASDFPIFATLNVCRRLCQWLTASAKARRLTRPMSSQSAQERLTPAKAAVSTLVNLDNLNVSAKDVQAAAALAAVVSPFQHVWTHLMTGVCRHSVS